MAHELQVRYSKLLDERLRAELVSQYVFNNRYEGQPTAGAVKIPTRGEAKVKDYNRATGVALDEGETTYITLSEFKDLAVNEILDGYEADAVPDNVVADRLDSAGYSIAEAIDKEAFNVLEKEGTKLALKADGAYEQVVEAGTQLSKNNVPVNGRVLTVTPEFYEELLLSDKFVRQGDLSQRLIETGAIGQVAGFAVYMTNHLTTTNVKFVASHPLWATQVNEWAKQVYLANLDNTAEFVGASAIKGRKIVGHKVTNKKAVLVGTKASA